MPANSATFKTTPTIAMTINPLNKNAIAIPKKKNKVINRGPKTPGDCLS